MYSKVEEVEGGFAPILKIKNVGRVDLGVYSTGEAGCCCCFPVAAACSLPAAVL